MPEKRIICLANSRKLNGRCVAGIELLNDAAGNWIRPVSGTEHGEVSEADRRYEEGDDPALLDIIDIEFKEPCPEDHQQENWLINDKYYWEKVGTATLGDLDALVAPNEPLWGFGDSTYNGRNDRISPADAADSGYSLRLIRPPEVLIKVFKPGAAFGNAKRRVQGRFEWGGRRYWLWVTDPIIEQRYLAVPDGEHQLGPCFLTISIGEEHEGACYKLIAGVIKDDR